ncbi:MAG: GmrSD restriction endonuclease domain-containing protein, partial [Nitrososphaerales archaeon]
FTALYIGLKGDYAYKLAWKRWDSDGAFPKRKLYLNLISEALPNDLDMRYDFKFLTEEEAAETDTKTFWFEVGKILNFKDHSEINDYLIDKGLNQRPKEQAKFANQTLFKLYQMIHDERIINFYLETSQELDKVLNIFIRVNSGGTPLSYSDILLSIASAQWKSRDAREEIISFVDEINGNGDFFFDKDFVLKNCLVLSGLEMAFKVDNFNAANMALIEKNWETITKAIRLAVDLVYSYGYNSQTLVSMNAVIPIAYYIMKIGNPDNCVESGKFKEDREKMRKWLAASLLKRAFSGQPDNVLRPIREIMNNKMNGFPLDKIIDKFKGKDKTLIFTTDDLDNLLNYEYNQSYTFMALSLLYPTLDFKNKFHVDHIHPKRYFKRHELAKLGLSDPEMTFYQESRDKLANLQLLEGVPNEEKSSKPLDKWLDKNFSSGERKDFLKKNHIPDVDLDFHNFKEFIDERSELINKRFKEILPMA